MVFVWHDYCFASEDLTGMVIKKLASFIQTITWNNIPFLIVVTGTSENCTFLFVDLQV